MLAALSLPLPTGSMIKLDKQVILDVTDFIFCNKHNFFESRLDTVMGYDLVLVLDQGRLVEKGFLDLFAKNLKQTFCLQARPTSCLAQEEYLKAWLLPRDSRVDEVLNRH